jgi:hypothetical protein
MESVTISAPHSMSWAIGKGEGRSDEIVVIPGL